MRKMAMLTAVVAMAVMSACGPPLTLDGNFTGLLTETDTCAGFGTNTYAVQATWLISANTQTKTLEINSDDACDKLQASFNGDSASLNATQCRLVQVGGGDTLGPRVDSGTISLDSNKDLAVNFSGSFVYSSPGSAPVNCTYSTTGTMYRFE